MPQYTASGFIYAGTLILHPTTLIYSNTQQCLDNLSQTVNHLNDDASTEQIHQMYLEARLLDMSFFSEAMATDSFNPTIRVQIIEVLEAAKNIVLSAKVVFPQFAADIDGYKQNAINVVSDILTLDKEDGIW